MSTDALGDRIKSYEAVETGRQFLPLLPIYARIDGRSFSKFTKDMDRPFDIEMSETMIETAKYLVDQTGATLGYTQSDEISLVWSSDDYTKETFFNRKIFKLTSVLAGLATAKFNQLAMKHWPDRTEQLLPTFDCRVFQLPNKEEAANCFVWRELDATKNAISMAARRYFSHKELQHKHGKQMQEMLYQTHKVNFNDYPTFFKRGTYLRRETYVTPIDEQFRIKIPEAKRPAPNALITRHRIVALQWPQLSRATNKVDCVFYGANPITLDSTIDTEIVAD